MKPNRWILFAVVTSLVAAVLAGASLVRIAHPPEAARAPIAMEVDASQGGYEPHHGPLGAPVPLYPPTEAGLVPISGPAPGFPVAWGPVSAAAVFVDGSALASNVYQTTVSCATKSGIGGTVSVLGGIDGSAASINAGIDGGVICYVPLPVYPPTSDASSFVGMFDMDYEVLSHIANGPATTVNWIGGRYNAIGLYSDAGLVTGSNFATPTNGYSASNPALIGFTWASNDGGGFDASTGSGNSALQAIQFLPSASGVSLYLLGWNYAGITDASTWEWTVTYTVTYSTN